MRRVLDLPRPGGPHGTLVGVFERALPRCSTARLMATFGHAFAFSMNPGGGEVWQYSNIDWGSFLGTLEDLPARCEVLQGKGPERGPRDEAWTRVRASIDAGVPVPAWQVMTVEQRSSGFGAGEWALLVGYDDKSGTYTALHRNRPGSYEIPFDQFGYSDPVKWFCVVLVGEAKPANVRPVLERAIKFARGERRGAADTRCGGFAALELWLEEVRAGRADRGTLPAHARFLRDARTSAAAYLREVEIELGPTRAAALGAAAGHYDRVSAAAARLAGGSDDPEVTLVSLIAAERSAVDALEAARD